MAWLLKHEPDWYAAAQNLVDACSALNSGEQRVRLMEKLCISLGDNLYPAFLKILCVVGEYGEKDSQALVADALVHALSTGRLPSGKLKAWGGSSSNEAAAFGHTRSLGPIEYLCAWYAQPMGAHSLSANTFDRNARTLLSLVSTTVEAKALYCAKLQADVEDPLAGSLSKSTRLALAELIASWQANLAPEAIVEAYMNAINGNAFDHLTSMPRPYPR